MKKNRNNSGVARWLSAVSGWLAATAGLAQANGAAHWDSVQHVREVVVVSKPASREVIPSQKLNGEQLERLNSHSVADALRYFSGLQLKDYGGVGGVKTVNIRSMGTHHLGISYDGIELGNAQNGQIDLGQFSLDNVEEITLYNGQKSAVLQAASDYGNAGSVYIRTRMPLFGYGKTFNLRARLRAASSDTWRLSLLYEQKLSERVSASFSGGALKSSGKYKFRYRRKNTDGTTAYDTTAVRQNGDIWALRAEGNLHGQIEQGMWNVKVYTYSSERGIPGAIVNNVWRRGERQWDHNFFAQARWQKGFGERFTTQWMAKYAYYDTRYVNNDTTQMPIDNTYRQQELYASTSNVLELMPQWTLTLSYDFRWNKLNANIFNFVYPHRFSNYVAVASAFDIGWLKMQGSLLGTFVKDHTRRAADPASLSEFTPAFFVNVTPFSQDRLSLRAFAKRSFRMPTFNDLYYTDMGNASLQPESALQYNIGVAYSQNWSSGLLRQLHIQADAYHNSVHDKIVAYPKGQQFRWTMLNLGRVHINGIDVEADATMAPAREWQLTARLQYTYQDARDKTNPKMSYYNHQIPYIPWHSGSAVAGVSWRQWSLNYSFIYAGERYCQQENIRYNYVQPWYTSDLSIVGRFPLKGCTLKVTAEVNNLFAQDYDVIVNYPMPKRNYALTIDCEL